MSENKIKTIFIGTPDFGIPALISLINNDNFLVIGVITQPDKKVGRQQILTETPIKKIATSYNLPVWQPKKLKEFAADMEKIQPDLIVVVAYAQILSKTILDMPKYGCINIHGSLLPKYRGAACIQAAILNGDSETGVTIMKMDEGLDTGPIIAQEKIVIEPTDTGEKVFNKLSGLAGKVAAPIISDYINGKIELKIQDNSQASLTKLLEKDDGKINWQKSATEIERLVRAMYSWPGAFTTFNGRVLKITAVEQKIININKHKIGEIFLHNDEIAVQCCQDALILKKIQLEGKKEMSATNFLNGHKNFIGAILI